MKKQEKFEEIARLCGEVGCSIPNEILTYKSKKNENLLSSNKEAIRLIGEYGTFVAGEEFNVYIKEYKIEICIQVKLHNAGIGWGLELTPILKESNKFFEFVLDELIGLEEVENFLREDCYANRKIKSLMAPLEKRLLQWERDRVELFRSTPEIIEAFNQETSRIYYRG